MKKRFKTVSIIAGIGFAACLATFIIALINSRYIVSVAFSLAAIYCIGHFISCFKDNN